MKLILFSVPILLVLCGCQTGSPRAALTVLDESLEPLRQDFNASKESVRIVALFSPV